MRNRGLLQNRRIIYGVAVPFWAIKIDFISVLYYYLGEIRQGIGEALQQPFLKKQQTQFVADLEKVLHDLQ